MLKSKIDKEVMLAETDEVWGKVFKIRGEYYTPTVYNKKTNECHIAKLKAFNELSKIEDLTTHKGWGIVCPICGEYEEFWFDYLVNDEQYYECVNCGSLLDYIENSKYITVNKRADVVVVE